LNTDRRLFSHNGKCALRFDLVTSANPAIHGGV